LISSSKTIKKGSTQVKKNIEQLNLC
jgi:hypothetical protein